jgi:cytochrome c oxidase subunit 2
MLAGATLLFALVMALLWLAFRRRTLAHVSERGWLVQGGLVLPAIVLAPLAATAFALGERLFAPQAAPAITVEAHARMWQWEFAYPGAAPGLRTLHVLHIPAGRPVEIVLHSDDVIHSFWVPRLAGKLDAIPGRANRLRLLAAEPGIYQGLCAEFCGRLHTAMSFAVIAHPPAHFAAALRAEAGDPP